MKESPDRLSALARIYARLEQMLNALERQLYHASLDGEAVRSLSRAIRDLSAAASVLERAAPPEEVRFHNE